MNDIKRADLKVSDLFSGDIELISPPDLYLELSRIIASPTKSIVDVSQIIEKDPNLTAKLLKLVNSAFFGFPSQITTLSRATTLIGLTELNNLVLSTQVMEKFSDLPGGMMSIYEFWMMSLRTALISEGFYRQIAAIEHSSIKSESEFMFVCGLLHEIGTLVFYRRIPELARDVGLLVNATACDELLTEQRLIGVDHYQVGAELARIWKLPEVIITTIQGHQFPERADAFIRTTAMIKLASQISKIKHCENFLAIEPEYNLIRLSEMEINSIIEETGEQVEEIINIFCSS